MGTRADFYIKKADEEPLMWLGSIAFDGYPDGIPTTLLRAKTPDKYLKEVSEFLKSVDHSTLPKNGWPWPWEDSNTTDYAYCFTGKKVYANCFGHGWYNPESKADEPKIQWEHEFPDMTKVQNVRFDKGSGAIFLRG